MPNAFAYIRYSSEPQGEGDSHRRQKELAHTTAESRGLTITEWIEDLGVSAFRGEHVETGALGKLLERVRQGKIEKGTSLLFENFDRLSRLAVSDSMRVILDFYDAGIILITTADNTVHDRNMGLIGLLRPMLDSDRAHAESARKADLIQRTWAAKRASANSDGAKITSICPAWLTPIKNSKGKTSGFEIDMVRAEIVRRIYKESANGIGKYSIAARLNVDNISPWRGKNGWHASYVHKILNNRSVIGEFQPHRNIEREFEPTVSRRVGGKRVPEGDVIHGYYPAVIDYSLWERTRAARAARRGKGGRKGKRLANLFSGLCRCGECDSTMTFRSPGAQYGRDYLICDNALRKLGCSSNTHHFYQPLESAIIFHLEDLLFDPANLDEKKIIAAENALVEMSELVLIKEQEIRRLIDVVALGNNPYVTESINQRASEISDIKEREREAKKHLEEIRGMQMTSERQSALEQVLNSLASDDAAVRYEARSALSQELASVITSVIFEPYNRGHVLISVAHGLRIFDIQDGKLVALISEDQNLLWKQISDWDEDERPMVERTIRRIARIKNILPENVVREILREAINNAEPVINEGLISFPSIRFPIAAWRFLVSQYPDLKDEVSLPGYVP